MWQILNTTGIIFIILFIYKFINILSVDTLSLVLVSPYSPYIAVPALAAMVYIFFSISLLCPKSWIYKKNFQAGRLLFIRLIHAAVLLCMICSSIYFLVRHETLITGKRADFADIHKNRVGPFVEFGPVEGSRIQSTAANMVVWWFTPEKIGHTAFLKFAKIQAPQSMETAIEELNGDGKMHRVVLRNLDAMTRYYYRIPDFDDSLYSFTTGPGEMRGRPFHVLCAGDMRNHGGASKSFYSEINSLADDMYRREKIIPAFKIVLGDLTRQGNDHDSWDTYFAGEKIHSARYPVMPVYGNHETYGDYGGNYNYLFPGQRFYSFVYGNALFLQIHNYDGLFGTVGRDQLHALRGILREHASKRWIIISLHEPLLSTGDFNMNGLLIGQLFRLFREYRVDLVLAGHDHHYDSFHAHRESPWGGTIYIVNGGGGSRLDGYLLRRKDDKRWKTWYHDRSSPHGLYQKDTYTERYHLRGELSWGFLDIQIDEGELTVSYYRWMDLEEYLAMTGQGMQERWEIVPVPLKPVSMVHRVSKLRDFRDARQR